MTFSVKTIWGKFRYFSASFYFLRNLFSQETGAKHTNDFTVLFIWFVRPCMYARNLWSTRQTAVYTLKGAKVKLQLLKYSYLLVCMWCDFTLCCACLYLNACLRMDWINSDSESALSNLFAQNYCKAKYWFDCWRRRRFTTKSRYFGHGNFWLCPVWVWKYMHFHFSWCMQIHNVLMRENSWFQ